jgi:hypothetical protein
MKMIRSILIASLLLFACTDPDDGADEAGDLRADRAPGGYRDVEEALSGDDFERWFALKRQLRRDFDDICGDTFCEGDFTNLESLSVRCSVSVQTGAFRSCIWLFAGSYESVRPATGSIEVNRRFFRCKLPLAGAPQPVLDALLAPGDTPALQRPLPGGERSLYDALGDCLD